MFDDYYGSPAAFRRLAAHIEGSMDTPHPHGEMPIVYACSGCSSAGQMANALALRIDHEHLADMSCIVGVGGDVPAMLNKARSGRPLLAIDGCALQCALHCLRRHGLKPTGYAELSQFGVPRDFYHDFSPGLAAAVYAKVAARLGLAPQSSETTTQTKEAFHAST